MKLVLKPRWKSSAAARESSGFGADYNAMIRVDGASEFKGYDHLELNGKVTALFIDGKAVDSVSAGRSGGDPDQTRSMRSPAAVGDKGELKGAGFSFAVSDTQKYGGLLVISVKSPAAH